MRSRKVKLSKPVCKKAFRTATPKWQSADAMDAQSTPMDVLLQKTFVEDLFSGKQVKNDAGGKGF